MAPLAAMKCSPQKLYASIVTTVYRRLQARVNKAKASKHDVVLSRLQILKLAAYYVITGNKYGLDRVLRNKRSPLPHLYSLVKKMDDKNRFLLDQTLCRVSWFQLRAVRPRVKSIVLSGKGTPPRGREFAYLSDSLNLWAATYEAAHGFREGPH